MHKMWGLFAAAGTAFGVACVGDTPSGVGGSSSGGDGSSGGSSGSSSGGASSGGASSGNNDPDASSSGNGSSGSPDAAVVHTGGNTLAQLVFDAQNTSAKLIPVPGGGILASFHYSKPTNLVLADTTIPCNACSVVAKLDASLAHVAWYAYTSQSVGGGGISIAPDGRVYWALSAPYAGTASIMGSVATTRSFTVVAGDGPQGDGTGGSRFVVALNDNGSFRWVHELRQTSTADPYYLAGFEGFGATTKAVAATFAGSNGTLAWTNPNASTGTLATPNGNYVVMELDADTGTATVSANETMAGQHSQFREIVGIDGYNGKGFAFSKATYAAGGAGGAPLSSSVSLGPIGGGAISAFVNYSTTVPTGNPSYPIAARYKDSAMAFNLVPTSLTVGDVSVQATFGGTDSAFFVLDKIAPTVTAYTVAGGSGYDVPVAMVQIPGADEVYCVGRYRSTDMQPLGTPFPSPADALTDGMYVMRAAVDTASRKLSPLWARGYMGNPGGRISLESATADAVSGDLYVTGWLGQNGTFDFGKEVITTDNIFGDKIFTLRIERGN